MFTPHPEHQEIANALATLLASSHCPQALRQQIEDYLTNFYQHVNLMNPEIVRTIYPYLLATMTSTTATHIAEEEPILDVGPVLPESPPRGDEARRTEGNEALA